MLLDPFFRRIIRKGELIITDSAGRTHRYGSPDPARAPVLMTFHDRRVPFDIMRRPTLGVSEAYMNGRLDVAGDDILALLDLLKSVCGLSGVEYDSGAELREGCSWYGNHHEECDFKTKRLHGSASWAELGKEIRLRISYFEIVAICCSRVVTCLSS